MEIKCIVNLFSEQDNSKIISGLQGTVKITVDDVDVGGLEDGGFFGETSILFNTLHCATCWAMSDCEVFMLTRNALEEVRLSAIHLPLPAAVATLCRSEVNTSCHDLISL